MFSVIYMINMDALIRNIDEKLYRRLRAEAASRGQTLGRLLEESVRMLLNSKRAVLTVQDVDNTAYESMRKELGRKYARKYVVFSHGQFLGAAESLEEAGALLRKVGAKRGLVSKIGEKRPAGGESLWSSLELTAA